MFINFSVYNILYTTKYSINQKWHEYCTFETLI